MQEMKVSFDVIDAVRRSSSILNKLSDEEIGDVLVRYKKFLSLAKSYMEEPLSPTKDIDEMWHLHMLRPLKYFFDCQSNFGELMDHDGGFGNVDDEKAELEKIYKNTSELWEKEYGESFIPLDRDGELGKLFVRINGSNGFGIKPGIRVPKVQA